MGFGSSIFTLLEIKSVFQDKGPGKHVRVLFTRETDRNSRLFSRQTGPLHVCHSLYPRKHASFPAVLFPLVYGRSHVLVNGETTTLDNFIEKCGQGDIAGKPDFVDYHWATPLHNAYSNFFQWLPCEVDISTENSRCTLLLF